jgi:hypothetical protein
VTPAQQAPLVDLLTAAAAEEGLAVEELRRRYLDAFEDDYWRQEVRHGRSGRTRLEAMLRHWLAMRTGEEVPSGELYPRFGQLVADMRAGRAPSDSPQSTPTLFRELAFYGRIYKSFDDCPLSTVEGQLFERLRTMEVVAATPLLLWVFGMSGDVVSRASKSRIVELLDGYLQQEAPHRLRAPDTHRLFLDLLREVKLAPERADDVMAAVLSRQETSDRARTRETNALAPDPRD